MLVLCSFAYGHLGDTTLPFFEVNGKGFAAQSVIEELQARRALSSKVRQNMRCSIRSADMLLVWNHRCRAHTVPAADGSRTAVSQRQLHMPGVVQCAL